MKEALILQVNQSLMALESHFGRIYSYNNFSVSSFPSYRLCNISINISWLQMYIRLVP